MVEFEKYEEEFIDRVFDFFRVFFLQRRFKRIFRLITLGPCLVFWVGQIDPLR